MSSSARPTVRVLRSRRFCMTYYARHLPHWQPPGRTIFLTWRLAGSLPATLVKDLAKHQRISPGKRFLMLDRILDKADSNCRWLDDPRIARIIAAAILRGHEEQNLYTLHAFVVMPNHVHVLLDPKVPLAQITRLLKGATAREANHILGRVGRPFWQDETFDHWIRNSTQFERVRRYIEQNPVKAGLVPSPHVWPWSSAAQ